MSIKTVYQANRPINRSKCRMFLGKQFFTYRRYIQWFLSRSNKYAVTIQTAELPYIVARHCTPLYRQLRNVDLWLQENKVINLRLAAETINGVILKPGESFSLWRLIGKPTAAKGFKEGMVLSNGSFISGVGGGLCQLSNLIYWMALHSPLTVTERWRHTHDVFPDSSRTQPFGSGATIVYNYIDLQLKNDTSQTYQLSIVVGKSELQGELRCEQPCTRKYEVYESEHLITQEWWGGYMRHNILRRKIVDLDETPIGDDFIMENHAIMMYEPLLTGSVNSGE